MRWYSPENALLLLIVLVAILYRHFVQRPREKGGIRYPLTTQIMGEKPSLKTRLLWVPEALRFVVLMLLIISMMRPQFGLEQQHVTRKGLDIMIVLDISGSMAAEDFKPNRLRAAQAITERFINGLQDHRIGLVVFAGVSMTECPLTLDYGVVTELLRRTDLRMLKVDGTAIGDGLANAIYKFKRAPGEKRDQVIVLLTDGENNAGVIDPLEAARIALERGIRVYTIGVGSAAGAPIPMDTPYGRQYMKNPDGSLYIPRIDEQLLKDIAFLTKGQYFRAVDNQALENIYKRIAELEKGDLDISRTVQYSERFYWYLAPALALFSIELYLRARWFLRVF